MILCALLLVFAITLFLSVCAYLAASPNIVRLSGLRWKTLLPVVVSVVSVA
jgi:hypothetical protein